ncbi:TRAP transporter large permease subunit [Vibrio chagasii]|nr:TRAP transporter large permease subunit [Vibrio chagasii]
MIIYALIASGASFGSALFLAGIVPGVLSAIALSVFVFFYATKHKIEILVRNKSSQSLLCFLCTTDDANLYPAQF